MGMAPFAHRFPELAAVETRLVAPVLIDGTIGPEYVLVELYCDEPGCDCRSVFLNVYPAGKPDPEHPLAVINFGWEEIEYYQTWMGGGGHEMARVMKGPSLRGAMIQQSADAPRLLKLVQEVLQDPAYVERLRRHYGMVREAIDTARTRQPAARAAQGQGSEERANPSRNARCPCGSGKKYKRCCGGKR